MKTIINNTLLFLILAFVLNCNSRNLTNFKPNIIYQTEKLIITQISENSFVHTSFLQTNDFGNVPCNGLIAVSYTHLDVYKRQNLFCWKII